MNALDAILNAQGGQMVSQLARQFGVSESQAAQAVSSLLPALTGGLQHNMASSTGAASLLGALSGGNHASYLDDLSALSRPDTVSEGNAILGHVLGSRDTSRQVAQHAAARTGLSEDMLKKMLPIVATLLMGALSRQAMSGRQAAAAGAPAPDALSSLSGFLDLNRDGSMADDVMGFVGKLFSGR